MEERIIELEIKDLDFGGINMISLVDDPAIEIDYMVFNKEDMNITMARVDEDKRIITGPALVPNKKIVRFDRQTNEKFYVFFSEDTVKKASEKYLIDKNNSNVSVGHTAPVNDISIIESWLVKDSENDKANALGYDVPPGTWMISMKVNNDSVWNEYIKPGILKGFSIEGSFTQKFQAETETIDEDIDPFLTDDDKLELIQELIYEQEHLEQTELAKKKTQQTYLAKEWETRPSAPGMKGKPVPVCPFCTKLNGIKVKYGSLWTHPIHLQYTQLKPKNVHKGCRCSWKRVAVTKKEYDKLK